MLHNLFNSLQSFDVGNGRKAHFYSLPQLEKEGIGPISKLPVSIRIILEAILRNYDGLKITQENVRQLANWQPNAPRTEEIPFMVARIVLQDLMGVPLLADLAAMRSAAARLGKDPRIIESLAPVDLVVDHSLQVDYFKRPDALQKNMEMEFTRNHARYEFLKWGMQAFNNIKIVPSGVGIIHQVNLEYLAKGVIEKDGVYFPDTVVGTDSHTTMVNGLGIVGWGVGGIEAEAAMLGQPVYFLMPDVIGVHLTGTLREGVTATDLALALTELLRKNRVVGKFVEFYGEGAARLSVPNRATIANMAPEYGATIGYFPVDEASCNYLQMTGRSAEQVAAFANYFQAQGLFGISDKPECEYSGIVELDLSTVVPSVAGPKRPQDRIDLADIKKTFTHLLHRPLSENGYGKSPATFAKRYPVKVTAETNPETDRGLGDGDVVIAAITSCTNTSNPDVMLAAGLLAKKAVEAGLSVPPLVKTSLAPGSRVVAEYLSKTGLQPYLDKLGFNLVGYGCTTCIGNSGALDPGIEEVIIKNDLVAAAVLSGNRNFEARIHPNIKANFLMSPPLVIAFALAGRVDIDLLEEPLGLGKDGKAVYLADIWPCQEEIDNLLKEAMNPQIYQALYTNFSGHNPRWNAIPTSTSALYEWNAASTYIQEPPFFADFSLKAGSIGDVKNGRALAIFGDSVTTDHISPAGAIKQSSSAGAYLLEKGVAYADFNTYGARRGNHQVMLRGTFGNVRIKNLIIPDTEGGVTIYQPDGTQLSIYDAAVRYKATNTPLLIFAGQEYGTGSSRDWAAKGTQLLGVKAVIAESFERIHRSNLVGIGVLPCQFEAGINTRSLGLDGTETFDLTGLSQNLKPRQKVNLVIHRRSGATEKVAVIVRIDTPIEIEYYQHGGIVPYVLRQIISQ